MSRRWLVGLPVLAAISCAVVVWWMAFPWAPPSPKVVNELRRFDGRTFDSAGDGLQQGYWLTLLRVGGRLRYHAIVCAANQADAEERTRRQAALRVPLGGFGNFRAAGVSPDAACSPGEFVLESW